MVKRLESNPTNMQDHRYLPTNVFKRNFNGTRVSDIFNLIKPCLRLKEVMHMHYDLFDAPLFLTKDELKNSAQMEAVLNNTLRLNTFF